jgi:hypothetical protein
VSLLGCATGQQSAGNDAALEAGLEAPAATCNGARVCQGDVVHACDGRTVGSAIEECPVGTCSLGRCAASLDCVAAESDRTSFAGCLFYVFEADNVPSDAPLPSSLLVANGSATNTASVILQRPIPADAGGTTWSFDSQLNVAPGGAGRLPIMQDQVQAVSVTAHSALRLASDQPITAALIQSDDRDQSATSSSAGTMVLPAQSILAHYRVMTYPQVATAAVAAIDGSRGGAGRIAIVGTQPGTHVTVTLSATAAATDPPPPFDDVPLEDGDVLQIYSAAEGSDLTGTEILADAPVAVFSGNMTTTYGKHDMPGVNSPDMVHEQMPPVGAWSRRWVAAALPPQANTCNTLLGAPGDSIWRILATEKDTTVTFDAPDGVVGFTASSVTLQPGQVDTEIVTGGSFKVTATNPVLVTQGIDCEPSLSLAVSLDRLLSDLTFAVLPNFDQLAAVVRPQGKTIMLDGATVPDALFLPAGSGFEVAQIPIPPCPLSAGVCAHELTGSFGMTLRGMDVLSSYALTAPTLAGCVDLADPTCIN